MSSKRNNSAVATSSSLVSAKKKKVSTQEPVSQTSKDKGSAQEPISQTSKDTGSASSQNSQVSQEGFRISFEKLINQNQRILQKLDMVVSSQKTLEERMKKLEQEPDSNNEELIKVINVININ
jgi:mevalonate kinase